MNIDGVNTLACLCRIEKDTAKTTKVYPLPHSTFLTVLSHSHQCTWSRTSSPTSPSSTSSTSLSSPTSRTTTSPSASTTSLQRTARSLTACTSAFSVHAALPRAPRTGGTRTSTSAPLSSCRPTAGSPTLVTLTARSVRRLSRTRCPSTDGEYRCLVLCCPSPPHRPSHYPLALRRTNANA